METEQNIKINTDTRIIDLKLNELIEIITNIISSQNKGQSGQESPNDFLNSAQTANLLGIRQSTLYSLTSKREIPYFSPCKINLFKRQDIIAYIEAHAKPSRQQIIEQANTEIVTNVKPTRKGSRRTTTWAKK